MKTLTTTRTRRYAGGEENLAAYRKDLWAQTSGYPFDRRARVLDEDAIIVAHPFDGRIYLSFIHSVEMGKGQGTKGLKFLIGLADKHGVEIKLEVKPVGKGGLNKRQLISWYKRHGFKQQPGETSNSLIYTPQTGHSSAL